MKTTIVLTEWLSAWDYTIILGSFLTTVLIVRWACSRHRENNVVDYIVMGRRLTLPLFVATLVATWYGGIFGVTEIAFEHGIFNFFTQGLFWYATYIFFAFFLASRIAKESSLTLPELIETKLGRTAGKIGAFFNFFNVLPIAYVLSLGIFLNLLTGLGLNYCIFIGVALIMTYASLGGLTSVVYSDMVQMLVMYVGVGSVIAFSLFTYGGIGFLCEALPAHYFYPQSDQSLLSMFVWGFIALGTLIDPNFYQRCFAAKDISTAKWGIVVATGFWFVFDIFTTLGGMYAAAVIPQAKASEAYLSYAIQLLPAGWRGIFIAGVIATIVSTINSFAFIATNTVTYDLLEKKQYTSRFRNALNLLFILLLTAAIATLFDGSIKKSWKLFGSYSAGCLLVPVLIKIFFPKFMSERLFYVTTVGALIGISLWYLYPRSGFWAEVDAIYIGLLICLTGVIGRAAYRLLRLKAV